MKAMLKKLLSAVLCLVLVLSFAACSSDDEQKTDPNANNVNYGGMDVEFKYSKDCSNWAEVNADSELFRADGGYQANDTEVVYLHFKNHTEQPITYKVNFRVIEGASGEATVGIADNVRTAFADSAEAVAAVEGNTYKLGGSYIYAAYMEADSTKTVAVVVSCPTAATMKLRVDFSVIALSAQSQNSSVFEKGLVSVNANAYAVVADAAEETVLVNADRSFKAAFAANSEAQGAVLTALVTPDSLAAGNLKYDIALNRDGTAYSGTSAVGLSLLVGYGLEGVEVFNGDTKIDSSYDMYSGMVDFSATEGGSFTVKYTGSTDIEGVLVQGSTEAFNNFNEAISYVVGEGAANIGDTVTFIIFGRAEYTVLDGEKISFTGENDVIKTVNVLGGNESAEIFITKASGSVPSLPYADDGVQINYSNLTFQSENEMLVSGEYSHHFDYRGDADISFRNCTFLKALATRGPNSSVVVDNCVFKCKTQNDTLKGYCYYSIQKIGMGEIEVTFTNNTVTENWGGINLDWAMADFYVANNTFSNITCSKPPIQLSNAATMVIENNTFTNIKDENVFRFYKSYSADSTEIVNNTIDADYLLQSDIPYALNSLEQFIFEGNIISSTTSLTMGHDANAPADQVSPHGYIVNVDTNTIK